ncbi:acetyl-CoA synthetase [archaeon]|nr:acetyl-CoA synthetase [archaeon]
MVYVLYKQMSFYEHKRKPGNENIRLESIDHPGASVWIKGKEGDYGEEMLELLALYGLEIAESKVAVNEEQAVEYAEERGYPVVMKIVSPDALHKSDAGGVIVGIQDREEVMSAFDRIRCNLMDYKTAATFEGVRIQKMASDGYDMFIGGKYDPSFGPVVFFGMGGIYIEVFNDVANSLCPAFPENIIKRIKSLKSYKVLEGLRGKEPGDVDAFVDAIVRVASLLSDFPQIRELDINPIRVFSRGVMALDARARIRRS